MHRNNIKEVTGVFLEEWHQKLHNNTSPDDIVICEAYLAFLRGNSDLNAYWKTLMEGVWTRQVLEGYERPIKSEPTASPHIAKDLIRDFENYLSILKSVHSGADLKFSIEAKAVAKETTLGYRKLCSIADNSPIKLATKKPF